MKNNRLINNGRPSRRIHLEFTHPTATKICIAGTFNDWRPSATPMVAVGNGKWAKDLALPPGSYEYRLVADGEWMSDPAAGKTVPNPFGGVNSVIDIPSESREEGKEAITTN
jgi:1,4-alpha-glucan branching enzyme